MTARPVRTQAKPGVWRVWCPVCGRYRQTLIPQSASTSAVVRAYDGHMAAQHPEQVGRRAA